MTLTRGDDQDRLSERMLRVSAWLSGAVIAVGAAGLIGWRFDVPVLKSVRADWAEMKPNTALLFVVLGLGIRFARSDSTRGLRLAGGAALLGAVAVIGIQYA